MTRSLLVWLAALAYAVMACRPTTDAVTPVPEPSVEPSPIDPWDGGDVPVGDARSEGGTFADQCALACATFRRLRCEEGSASCEPVCRRAEAARLTDLHLACVGAGRTVVDVQRCDPRNCKVTR